MRGKTIDVGATSREQLLALVQRRGAAQRALAHFTSQATALVHNMSVKTSSAAALSLLRAAVERRQPEWTASLTEERHAKRQRVSSSSKDDVVFAAKVAQSLVKVYAVAKGAEAKAGDLEDLVAAMDLACVALYVVCALGHAVRLGDLVVDNLLYQVAKKYAEIPSMRESASCVAACVHLRLWNAHGKLCDGSSDEKSQLIALLGRLAEDSVAFAREVTKQVELVAEFPPPKSFHTAQFTRLLLGHTNTCVSLLSSVKDHEAVLHVAENTLSPWIAHLQNVSGQDAKLASSFCDRTFRILWKLAAAIDGAKRQSDSTHGALRFRSTALSFLIKCSNYSSLYFIQQVHRVGVQHERSIRRSQQGLNELYEFYDRSAITLSESLPASTYLYSSDSLQWEYVLWLEHFALICELSGMHLRSAMILENAVQYVQLFKNTGRPIEPCLLASIAGTLFSAISCEKRDISPSSRDNFSNSAIIKNLESGTGRMIRDLVHSTPGKFVDQCEKLARVNLKRLETLAPFSFVSLDSKDHSELVPFIVRSLKRSSTKTFNYAISVQHSVKYQLYHQVITNFDEICKAIKELRSMVDVSDIKIMESLVLEQSRLHRMAVILSVRRCFTDNSSNAKPALHMVSRQVTLVRELLDNATMDGKLSGSILQGVLGDLNSIARECYNCATRCYKMGNYPDTISALLGSFELVESYLEYVMCSNLSVEDIHKAHTQLKVDTIVSLLAHCFRQLGNCTKSRIFTGYSILYCGDIHERIPQASVDKYVDGILEEVELLGKDAEPFIINEFKAFLENTTHVFKSREIAENQIMILWREFRDAFERASAKIMMNMRGNNCAKSEYAIDFSSPLRVQLCGALEHYLNGELMKIKMIEINGDQFGNILLDVSQSLAKRKQIYCSYYAKHNFSDTIEGLVLVHRSLIVAAENLLSVTDAVGVDLGGIYGWRGVIAMEIALMVSYAGLSDGNTVSEKVFISEESAIADIERCLMYWRGGDPCGFLFDKSSVVQCLESVCNTLSLLLCSSLEMAARKILKAFQSYQSSQAPMLNVIPPPLLELLNMNTKENVSIVEAGAAASPIADPSSEIHLFERVDKELFAAETFHLGDNRRQACQHLLNAITILGDIKRIIKACRTATLAKAVGMREFYVHMILSDIHFREGRSKYAIAEAKSALRVCSKMAKKFTAPSSPGNVAYFKLPPEILAADYELRKSASLYFMALECSSWDLLLAAKVSLCRVASLYSLSDQPHRAASYLTEAMHLVGGLNLRLFPRGPFYEYAELELNASHLEKAKVAISLLSLSLTSDLQLSDANHVVGAITDEHHSCIQFDMAAIEQKCNEIVQQGDVHLNEGKRQDALDCYIEAIGIVDTAEDTQSSVSKRLGSVKARCWRKYTQLQSQMCEFSDQTAVETLLGSMKKLKRSLKSCSAYVERVKCMLELGRTNTRLLRSASPRAFTSLHRTLIFLEDTYLHGDHLGIPHLSHEVRTALGMAYFAEMEESVHDEVNCMEGSERATFLSWASSALLANAGSDDVAGKELASAVTSSDIPAQEALVMQLEELVAGPRVSQEPTPHKFLAGMAQGIAEKVQRLPDKWIIVSLMIGLSSELVVTRFLTTGSTPITFCLPNVAWTKCIRELKFIIQHSREILSGHTAEEASTWDTERKREWWNSRKLLDKRIGEAVISMQETLGFWRCLLVGGSSTPESRIIQRCWSLLTKSKCGPIKLAQRNQTLLCAIADTQACLSDREMIDGLKHIAAEIEVPVSDSLAKEALQVLRTKQKDPESSPSKVTYSNLSNLNTEEITRMKVSEVKQLLAAEGLSTNGLKKVLVERLIVARDAAFADRFRASTEGSRVEVAPEFSTILILGHELQQFPWEGMDVMGLSSGVTRMPSLDLIVQNAKLSSSVRRDRVHYLLNPAGDLKSTQSQLGPILERGATTYGWEGIVGEVPDPVELRNYLLAADLYIYCGHGSGEAYLHRDKVLNLQPYCSAALLFGCSSGRLEREGIFGPSGAVLAYLRAGSPAVLAMLWDVTDRDIDQLSVKVLQDWLLSDTDDSPSLAQVLQHSRGVCKLKYLNGHAAVCYGLPLYVSKS